MLNNKIQRSEGEWYDTIRCFLAIFVIGPILGFFCGIAVSIFGVIVSGYIIDGNSMLFMGGVGLMTAVLCVALSYKIIYKYNAAVAIIYCMSGTLIAATIATFFTLEAGATPLSSFAGIIGFWIGCILLNFNIGVPQVEDVLSRMFLNQQQTEK